MMSCLLHIIAGWAKKHGYTLADIYPPQKEQYPLMESVQRKDTDLIISDPRTGETIHTFYGDAGFTMYPVVLAGGRVLVAGDSTGRVMFLRWVGEDGASNE